VLKMTKFMSTKERCLQCGTKLTMTECKHEHITVDEVYGEQFCEDCNGFVDKE
jgi:hypothetical protein